MKILKNLINDHLYGNTLWLIADSIMLTGFGFLFWTINTRLFSSEQVGLASTLLASVGLLVALSLLGFDIALIRYLPGFGKKNDMINSCFSLSGIIALLISVIFVLKVDIFLPKLILLKNGVFGTLFIIFVVFNLFSALIPSVFIAIRKSKFVFIKDLIFSILKLVFPFFFVFLGAYGIFSSWMISVIIAFIISLFFWRYKPRFRIHKKIVKKMLKFSVVNYISNFLGVAPGMILPLMITNVINPTTTAYFYIAWMIAMMLFIVPVSISKSLLSEGSRIRKENLKKKIKKSIKFVFVLLVPAMIAVVLLSKYFLLLFGQEYSENAYRLLQILALSSIPFAINKIYITINNIQHKINVVLLINLIVAVGSLSLSYMLLSYGLIMVGFSWLVTQILVASFSTIKLIKIKND